MEYDASGGSKKLEATHQSLSALQRTNDALQQKKDNIFDKRDNLRTYIASQKVNADKISSISKIIIISPR